MFSFCRVLFLFIGIFSAIAPAAAAKRVALVIGNGAYTQITPLKKPPNDAKKMAEVLRGMNFEVILATDVRASELEGLEEKFRNALKDADAGFFFYSGHGFQTNRPEQQHPVNRIVAIDFSIQEADIAPATLALDTVVDALRRNAKVGFIFMDACRNDPQLAEASQRLMSGTRSVTIARGFSPVTVIAEPAAAIKARAGKGPAGLLIAYATDPGNVAFEGENGLYSPFTGSLVKHLATPGLSVSEIMGRVSAEVSTETQGQQTPWNVSSLTAGTYKFVSELPGAPRVTAAPRVSAGAQRPARAAPQHSTLPPNLGAGAGAGL